MIKFNINNYVFVKLTSQGKEELLRQHNQKNKEMNGLFGEYRPKEEDENGWSKWQLYNLMNTFGHMMYNDCSVPVPFETTIEFDA